MWLPWEYGLMLTVLFGAAALWMRATGLFPAWRPWAQEATTVAALYTLWRIAGRLSVSKIDGAIDRGRDLWELQQDLFLPDEAWLQEMILGHSWLVQAANIYYGGMHVPAMGVFLVWMFVRHRDAYPVWRTTLGIATGACLAIQLIPVAPPRFVPELGIVDTPALYGQSVYSPGGENIAGQLQAMPSIHLAWAAIIAFAAARVGPPRWRWIGHVHMWLTMYVVVVTGNHFWLDGFVAIALVWVIYLALIRLVPGYRPTRPANTEHSGDDPLVGAAAESM